MSSWDLQIQGADDMLPTIEVDCADSHEAVQLCLQAIQRGLVSLTGGKNRRVTVYVYEGPSINFRRPTNSIWFGIAGPERLLTVLHAALNSVPGTRSGLENTFQPRAALRSCTPTRHQMWRHMDGAWEVRGRRQVFGLFIVEGQPSGGLEVPETWVEAARETLSAMAIEGSLPHRAQAERDGITSGFLGVTSWQAVCAQFDIDYASLPDRVGPAENRASA